MLITRDQKATNGHGAICLVMTVLIVVVFSTMSTITQATPFISKDITNDGTKILATAKAGTTEIHKIRYAPGAVSPFERPLLDYMERMGTLDGTKHHVKYLLNEQESYDFKTELRTVDILHRSRFNYEQHNVTTEDGYITQLVRIINPLVPESLRKMPPVVLYGGQGVSPAIFLMASLNTHAPARWPRGSDWPDQANGANRSLAISLANSGYEVWIVGARGSDASNDGYKPKVEKKTDTVSRITHGIIANSYWSFSHDEIIKYEFGAQLNMIRNLTKQEKVSLITYSNGAFIAHAFCAQQPEYCVKHIDTMISLAPAVFINKFNLILGATGFFTSLVPGNIPILEKNLDNFARGSWFQVCKSRVVRYSVCKTALNMLYGFSDTYQTQIELSIFNYIGRPQSIEGFRQTLQCSYSDNLQHYDRGVLENLAKYKQLFPPKYDLEKVSLERMFIISGSKDGIADDWSVKKLIGKCGRKPLKHIVVPGYNHLDMLAAWDVNDQVVWPILEILDQRYMETSMYSGDIGSAYNDDNNHGQIPFREGSKGQEQANAGAGVAQLASGQNQAGFQSARPTSGNFQGQQQQQQQQQQQVNLGSEGGIQFQEQQQQQQQEQQGDFEGSQQQRQQQQQQQQNFGQGDGNSELQSGEFGRDNSGGVESSSEFENPQSPTMGWSDQELGLSSARGIGKLPKGLVTSPSATAKTSSAARQLGLNNGNRPKVDSSNQHSASNNHGIEKSRFTVETM